ncbi:hypothetical protein [Psychrobacillus sp. OK028]|uniref:hypothetical protein n=1 Tax=Psychrobacillus sp. OK028 TaxID=1884359 RepID=UPI001113B48B|nr:hypothetical protein [Psychrobacillus sp. OK028]
MKSNIPLFVFLSSLLLITSCTSSNSAETDVTKKENVTSIVDEKVPNIADTEVEFSYLTDFSEEELKSYNNLLRNMIQNT